MSNEKCLTLQKLKLECCNQFIFIKLNSVNKKETSCLHDPEPQTKVYFALTEKTFQYKPTHQHKVNTLYNMYFFLGFISLHLQLNRNGNKMYMNVSMSTSS